MDMNTTKNKSKRASSHTHTGQRNACSGGGLIILPSRIKQTVAFIILMHKLWGGGVESYPFVIS